MIIEYCIIISLSKKVRLRENFEAKLMGSEKLS